MPKNADVLGEKLAAVKARIKAACKKFGIEISDEVGASRALDDLETIERRGVLSPVELRALPDSEGSRMIGGYAAVFDRESRMIPRAMGGSFVERVTPGFFEEARSAGWPGNQGSGVLCRFNHSDMHLLGSTAAGTCTLNIDRTGLEYRAEVPNCRDDVLELVGRRDIRQSSFTFMDAEDDWSYRDGVTHRTLISGAVLDVAPVSAVAGYQDTTVSLRSLAHFKDVPVEDVYDLVKRHELRQLWVRTDQTPMVHIQRTAEQLSLDIGDGKPVEEERTVTAETEPELITDQAEPVADPPALESEPPATLSWQEAHLKLLSTRPYDPICK